MWPQQQLLLLHYSSPAMPARQYSNLLLQDSMPPHQQLLLLLLQLPPLPSPHPSTAFHQQQQCTKQAPAWTPGPLPPAVPAADGKSQETSTLLRLHQQIQHQL
jgi:hypothetical protein